MAKFELKLRRRNIPEADIIVDMRMVASNQPNKLITVDIYDQLGIFGSTTVIRRFGSWNEALSVAGLVINNRINIPDEELFENLAEVWQPLGRQPVGSDLQKSRGFSRFSLGTYEKRFRTWNAALTAFINHIENNDPQLEPINADYLPEVPSKRTPRKINWRLRAHVLIRDNCICQICGASPAKDSSVTLHVDHKYPWSKGGETILENLQTLCVPCNIGKSNELFD